MFVTKGGLATVLPCGAFLLVPEEEEVIAMTTTTRGGPPRVFLRKVGHFLLHYLQMCMECCVGGVTLGVEFFGGAALIGYPDLIVQAPVFSTLALAVILTVPMGGDALSPSRVATLTGDGISDAGVGDRPGCLRCGRPCPNGRHVRVGNPPGVSGHAHPHAVAPQPLYGRNGPPRARRMSPESQS